MRSSQQSKSFRVAFLGAGGIATAHATALKAVPGATLVAICDLDENKARSLQQGTGAAEIYPDLELMLERVAPDVVHILLPPVAHASAAETCLAAGAHVLVEKPLCVTPEQCRGVQRAAIRAGREAGVNHNFTYMPGLLQVLDAIRAYRLGAVEHVTVVYSLPMPGLAIGPHTHWMFSAPDKLMFELGAHPLSAIYRLIGKHDSVSTAVSGQMRLTNGALFYNEWQSSLVCERGTAQLMLAVGKPYCNVWMHVLGEDGEAFIDFLRYTVRISENTRYTRAAHFVNGWQNAWALFQQSALNFWQYGLGAAGITPAPAWQQTAMNSSIGAFYASLAAGRPVPMPAGEGVDVVEMCQAVVDAAVNAYTLNTRQDIAHG